MSTLLVDDAVGINTAVLWAQLAVGLWTAWIVLWRIAYWTATTVVEQMELQCCNRATRKRRDSGSRIVQFARHTGGLLASFFRG
jgi:hypothetical protein